MRTWSLLLLGMAVPAHADQIAAIVDGETIMMSEVDAAGGHAAYELAEELYNLRVQALYRILTDALLEREALELGTNAATVEQLEILDKAQPVTEGDIDAALAEQPGFDALDPRVRGRIAMYLHMVARSERKKVYMEGLFGKYGVRVALQAPPAPPPEAIHGPLAPALGPAGAPVTVVSFSDYQCPYCRRMLDTLVALHDRYPQTVQIVYRHYPLHDGAAALAEAALCAGDQDRFWDYHLALFEPDRIDASQALAIAAELKLDLEAFQACLVSGTHTEEVQGDFREGQRLQITGTPTNFVNGRRLRGAVPLPELAEAVEEALRRLEPTSANF